MHHELIHGTSSSRRDLFVLLQIYPVHERALFTLVRCASKVLTNLYSRATSSVVLHPPGPGLSLATGHGWSVASFTKSNT